MILDSGKNGGNVLEEFDFDGVSAQVVMVQPGDLDSEMKKALAENLANTNFVYLDMPEAQGRHAVKELLLETREQILGKDAEGREAALKVLETKLEKGELAKVQGVGDVKEKIERLTHLVRGVLGEVDDDFINQQFGQMGESIYPDYAKSEHVRGYQRRFDTLVEDVSLLGVKVDDKIVAVVGYAKVGDTLSGREVFEFTKGSTLDDLRFRRKGFLKKMMKLASARVQAEHPEVIWVGASVNPVVIESFRSKGWNVVDVDDSHEAVVAMNSRNPDYVKTLKAQKYKAFYFDPKEKEASELKLIQAKAGDVSDEDLEVLIRNLIDSTFLPGSPYTREEHIAGSIRTTKKAFEKGIVLAVKDGEKTVGIAAAVSKKKMPDGRDLYEFTKVSVLPEYRGRKLGSKLIEERLRLVRESFPDCPLSTATKNENAIAVYTRLGWQKAAWGDESKVDLLIGGKKPDGSDKNGGPKWLKEWELMRDAEYKEFFFDPKEGTKKQPSEGKAAL